jgi:hypothetical protein
MYVYIDKYDYLLNNLNNDEIDEEIDHITEKLSDIEQNNFSYFKNLKDMLLEEEKKKINKVDIFNDEVTQNRFENITNQIYSLQMKQFSESICNIKRDLKKNKYVLLFDKSEGIEALNLDEEEYKELLKFRDPLNSISIYDLFQEKIHSYYNTQSDNSTSDNRLTSKKRGRSKTPVKNIPNKKPHDKKEEIEIAKIVSVNYNFCHHCKQRKPADVMIKCNSASSGKIIEKPIKTFYVNSTTVVRSMIILILENKNFIITNFTGDPKDILDGYLNKSRYIVNFRNPASVSQVIL